MPDRASPLHPSTRLPYETPRSNSSSSIGSSISVGKYHPSHFKNENPEAASTSPPHARKKSEAQRKIQQYQRDMIEQATAASRLINNSVTKPPSARLMPLGSPGPVTPMALEGANDYMFSNASSNAMPSAALGSQHDAVSKMIRAEEERRRREGQSSPGIASGH